MFKIIGRSTALNLPRPLHLEGTRHGIEDDTINDRSTALLLPHLPNDTLKKHIQVVEVDQSTNGSQITPLPTTLRRRTPRHCGPLNGSPAMSAPQQHLEDTRQGVEDDQGRSKVSHGRNEAHHLVLHCGGRCRMVYLRKLVFFSTRIKSPKTMYQRRTAVYILPPPPPTRKKACW